VNNAPFNPLDMDHLGESIANAMLLSDPTPLSDVPSFEGAGLYAIYYSGGFPAYQLLVNNTVEDFDIPIYVGKAIPEGARKGKKTAEGKAVRALAKRLRDHAKSVDDAENLDIADFACRWLVVEPFWIPLGERVLIRRFGGPVWNQIVEGFGNHDPGAGRRAGLRTRWDTLHPGRLFAPYFPARSESAEDIATDVVEYLNARYQV
jgi:hypothetical protein